MRTGRAARKQVWDVKHCTISRLWERYTLVVGCTLLTIAAARYILSSTKKNVADLRLLDTKHQRMRLSKCIDSS